MKKKKFYSYFIFLLVVIAIEVFIFNWRTWESLTFPQSKPGYQISIDGNSVSDKLVFPDQSLQTIQYNYLNQNVQNIKINLHCEGNGCPTTLNLKINYSDEGHSQMSYKGNQTYIESLEETHIIRIHPYGDVKNLRISFHNPDNAQFTIIASEINVQVPLKIQTLRILTLFILFILIYQLYQHRSFFTFSFNGNSIKRKNMIIITALCHILLFVLVLFSNPFFWKDTAYPHPQEYHYLAEALAKGQTSLLIDPSEELKQLSNPYDSSLRIQEKVYYFWDFAYYKGKYFVYFGIGPELVFYLPYFLITGTHLPNPIPIMISEIFFIFGVFLFFEEIVIRYYQRKIPLGLSLLLSSATVLGSGAFFIARRLDLYSVPIMMGLALTIWGLFFWLKSRQTDQSLNCKTLFIGSCFMAFVAACRPQLILGSFLAFLFFLPELKNLKEKQNQKYLMVALLPYVIIAAGLMYYNWIRFDSPFDFGSSYNLTTNDMTRRGFVFDRFFIGIFTYLFQLPNIQAAFPYLQYVEFNTNYIGELTRESMTGGLLSCNPILYFSFLLPYLKRIKKHKTLTSCLTFLILGILIMFIDIQCAGLLQRYISDFAIFIFIGTTLILFTLYIQMKEKEARKIFVYTVLCLCLIGILYNLSLFFLPDSDNIALTNPQLYSQFYRLFH